MRHQALRVNGASLHIAELGEGAPLLLLHGWPEFWLTWEPVMLRLSKRYRLVAPDLRAIAINRTGRSARPITLLICWRCWMRSG
jgi:pimeloyl-ACP methyl ester carboxylesterase